MKEILLSAALMTALVGRAAVEDLPFAGQPVVGAGDTVPPPAPVTPTDEQMQRSFTIGPPAPGADRARTRLWARFKAGG